MAAFLDSEYADLINTTFPSRERKTWSEQVRTLQNYHVMNRIITRKNIRQRSGRSIQFNARFFSADQAEMVKVRQRANPYSKDMHALGTAPWRELRSACIYDEQIIDENAGSDEQLVDYMVSIENDAEGATAELLETQFFQGPTSLADETSAHGLPVWVTKGTGTTFSFESVDPSYVTGGAGGFAAATYPNWRSGFSRYVNRDDDDLYYKMRVGLLKTGFNPPVAGPYSNETHEQTKAGYYTPKGPDREFITTMDVLLDMEQQARTQNENLRNELNMYAGEVTFFRAPITWSAWLQENADATANSALHGIDPIYCLDWNVWEVTVLKGNLFKQTPAMRHPDYPRTWQKFTFLRFNFTCRSRRNNFLLSKPNT